MDIETRVQQLCDNLKEEKSKKSTDKDMAEFELKNIQFKMNKHLQAKQKIKYQKVSIFNYAVDTDYNAEKFDKVIQNEIDNKFTQKKWSSIPLFMKWNLVQTYLAENNVVDANAVEIMKKKLMKGELNVQYDHENKKITSLE